MSKSIRRRSDPSSLRLACGVVNVGHHAHGVTATVSGTLCTEGAENCLVDFDLYPLGGAVVIEAKYRHALAVGATEGRRSGIVPLPTSVARTLNSSRRIRKNRPSARRPGRSQDSGWDSTDDADSRGRRLGRRRWLPRRCLLRPSPPSRPGRRRRSRRLAPRAMGAVWATALLLTPLVWIDEMILVSHRAVLRDDAAAAELDRALGPDHRMPADEGIVAQHEAAIRSHLKRAAIGQRDVVSRCPATPIDDQSDVPAHR